MQIKKGKQVLPRRVMLYGVHGVGKTTWAAQAPDCLIMNLEDGCNDVDCHHTERMLDFDSFNLGLSWLNNNKHSFKWLAIDTVDWLEKLIHTKVAKDAGKKSVSDIGYGAGYKQALTYWDDVLFRLNWLRTEHGMGIILLAHSDVKRFQSPEQDSYDRYSPALHDLASKLWQEWCDEVLFASYRVFTRKEEQGFNRERTIAVGDGERFIRTQETAAVLAKNRLQLPAELDFTWAAYAQHLPATGNIAGKVVNGSSKVQEQELVTNG